MHRLEATLVQVHAKPPVYLLSQFLLQVIGTIHLSTIVVIGLNIVLRVPIGMDAIYPKEIHLIQKFPSQMIGYLIPK
jgi:hypothetical protein